jgi:hypothetical protein
MNQKHQNSIEEDLQNHQHKANLSLSIKWAVCLVILAQLLSGSVYVVSAEGVEIDFTGDGLLGRLTDSSVTISIIPDSSIDYYYEYGESSGVYPYQTSEFSATGGEPHEVTISGLDANTQYFYRMQYNYNESGWVIKDEHSFWTQRAPGTTFTFSITADNHVNIQLGNVETWTRTLNNVVNDDPDFLIDLGDTFDMDSVSEVGGAEDADASYLYQRQFFEIVGNSAAVYVMPGNHEQTEGWHLDDFGSNPANSLPAFSTNAMKKYYLNPITDGFYTGNDEVFTYIAGDGLLEDYYAWTWGDALFVVIDPFWYTTTKPYTGNTGGGETSETGSGDRWDWTLGYDQFMWLKGVLENSNAAYKFIFAHHMVGGSEPYVRGGAVPAHMFEWGGYNADGTTWGFDTQRPGWGDDPIHQIFIDNGVSAFFHGHDHQYAYEVRDGIVYQSLPAAGFSGGFNYYHESDPYTEKVLDSPGHLKVIVTPAEATVQYVSSGSASNGTIRHSYTIAPNEQPEEILGDVNGNGVANSLDALIVLKGDVGLDISSYCPVNCGDVNDDGFVNSTDALLILKYDVGLPVSYPVGLPGCNETVSQPPGCSVP